MNDNIELATRRIYEFFAEICKIPHPSFYCDGIRKFLEQTAFRHNLEYREDTAGNVRIDRRNAVYSDTILLQAHMDMVPQSSDADFDFTSQPIEFETVDGFMQSKGQKTTLGADNGIGMATALAAMLDDELKDIPLCAVFTADEETDMHGARNIDPAFLDCKAIINLDSETLGEIIIGCAGGVRISSIIPVKKQPLRDDCKYAVKVICKGLKGGHSGGDIHLNRGNAILILLDFISRNDIEVSSIKGGTLVNAIPREAEITGAVHDLATLKKSAGEFTSEIKKEFDTLKDFSIDVVQIDRRSEFSIKDFRKIAVHLKNTPNGVISVDKKWDCTATSNNLGIINGDINSIELQLLPRSNYNFALQEITGTLKEHFAKLGGTSTMSDGYPAWENSNPAEFLNMLKDTYHELFNADCEIKYIHAGLECALFQRQTKNIPIVSVGPTILDPHSPYERLELYTLKNFYEFLSKVLQKILKK